MLHRAVVRCHNIWNMKTFYYTDHVEKKFSGMTESFHRARADRIFFHPYFFIVKRLYLPILYVKPARLSTVLLHR